MSAKTVAVEPAVEQRNQIHSATDEHSEAGAFVRDVIIGSTDVLTVPFALTADMPTIRHGLGRMA
jgi:hypothetical protein